MPLETHPVERCASACAERAWRLAYALLRDSNEAFDAVQQAFLVAARKPDAVPHGDPWPWFRVVVAHEVCNLRRKRRPATGRLDPQAPGGAMDAQVARTPSPSSAAEAADLSRRVARAVDGLPTEEREAIVLVHLGGLSHASAAEVLGVARQTVTERARRGLDALARTLGKDPSIAAGALVALPVVAPAFGLAGATQRWIETAMGGAVPATTAATASLSSLGGSAMATSKAWVAGVIAAAGVGFFGGAATDGFGLVDGGGGAAANPPAAVVRANAGDVVHVAESLARKPEERPDARAANGSATLRAENERLTAMVEGLQRELATRPRSATAKGPKFTFGEMGRLAEVRDADWPGLAAASKVVNDSIVELLRYSDRGEPAPKEVHMRLQENVEKVRTYEYRTIDRIPTAAKHNGELTHPITATNLLATVLEQAGLPLSESQVSAFERLGLAFEEDFARLRTTWDSMPRSKRVLEELKLKSRVMDGLWTTLTEEQKPFWIEPSLRGLASVDLYDASLMIIHTSPLVTGTTVAEMRPKLVAMLRPKTGIAAEAAAPRFDAAVDSFLARTTLGLETVPRSRARNYTLAQATAAGEATVALVDTLLRDPDVSPEKRKELFEDPTWYVPRLLAP